MPFARPTPTDLNARIATEIELALPGADARQRRTIEGVIARMLTIASHELHGHLDWIARQVIVDTAEREELERHAAIWGVARKGASAAAGTAAFSGAPGAALPADTRLRRADGALYETRAGGQLDGGGGLFLPIEAIAAGPVGNTAPATLLTLVSPLAGVAPQATVEAGESGDGLGGGQASESDGALLARVLDRIQLPPHGGNFNDWRTWALEVLGVTRAWPLPGWMGAGTVGLAIVADDAPNGPIPDQALVDAVAAYIDSRRPVTAEPFVFAPTPVTVPFEIALGVEGASDPTVVQSAIEAELRDFFRRESAPGGPLYLSRISAAVSRAAGEFRHVLIAPATDILPAPGAMPVPGPIVWSAL